MDIDFVLPWVDGNDPAWRAERARFAALKDGDDSDVRYRDWGTLPYWFRAVDKFAPWVHRVHFITWGHLPAWLNTEEPRLHVVRHEDYIPGEYLPTFSSHPIELNIHRIEGLAERFVYFNDDIFLTGPVREEDFFRGGLPCDTCRFTVTRARVVDDVFAHVTLNGTGLINRYIGRRGCPREAMRKWLSPRNGLKNVAPTLLLSLWPYFTGFSCTHLAVPFEKRSFEQVWAAEPQHMDATCRRRFRSIADLSQLAVRAWRLARGEFVPAKPLGRAFFPSPTTGVGPAAEAVAERRYRMICINDDFTQCDFAQERRRLNEAFEKILPQKSAFER